MSFLAAAFGSLMQMMLPMQLTDRESAMRTSGVAGEKRESIERISFTMYAG